MYANRIANHVELLSLRAPSCISSDLLHAFRSPCFQRSHRLRANRSDTLCSSEAHWRGASLERRDVHPRANKKPPAFRRRRNQGRHGAAQGIPTPARGDRKSQTDRPTESARGCER